ncbi:MAG: hypothetical protein DME22_23650 [Verrucomicrobia bacterium]|nr:MAG: hypothetical protein DME22_23650 [Verrucomicrobiota bacterium]PYJ95559.1 MAG: hypothetical protein DME23_23775 [Verrucomicrobiota bacterium]
MSDHDNESATVKPKPPSGRGKFPAGLHVLLARGAKVGLVIRRGRSKSVCTVLWNRERDTFKLGQWMRGRIYERRCDLSPNGTRFIYFAMNGRWQSETKGSWTAISRVPFLKAMSLFAKGDCWHGGGLFLSDREFWLNDGYGHTELKAANDVRRNVDGHPPDYFGGECLTVYYNRLQRDGWVMGKDEYQGAVSFEKKQSKSWLLRKLAFAEIGAPPGRGCYWDAHELRHESTDTVQAFPEWEWADFVDGRLVWTSEGQLRAARLGRGKLLGEKVLHDFNDMKCESIAAPY